MALLDIYIYIYIDNPFYFPFQFPMKTIVEETIQKAEEVWTKENTVLFIFSYEDYKKFLKLVDEEKERQKAEKEIADLQFVIESAQADIEKLKRQSEAEIKQANTMMAEVTKNITLSV